jgi:hypothetical protein
MSKLDKKYKPASDNPDEFHYYGTHGLGWATADTLDGAIRKAFQTSYFGDMRSWLLNCHKAGQAGIGFFTCRVPLPASAAYKIEYFMPLVEGLTERKNHILTYVTKKHIAYGDDLDDEITRLKHRNKELRDKITDLRDQLNNLQEFGSSWTKDEQFKEAEDGKPS